MDAYNHCERHWEGEQHARNLQFDRNEAQTASPVEVQHPWDRGRLARPIISGQNARALSTFNVNFQPQ